MTDREGPIRVSLALGSGGARGYAHIGAIQVLEERGFEIVSVAGSSMGALVGGLHAVGKLDDYVDWVQDLTQFDVIRLLDPSLSAPGAMRAAKILRRVDELLDGVSIEDMPVPYTAVATDLLAHKEVWFQRGPADVAIRASISIPGVFAPVMLNGRLLVDGGLMDPVPVAPTASARADLVVAVDLSGGRTGVSEDAPTRESAEGRPVEEWAERFRRGASGLLDRDVVRSLASRFGISPDNTPTGGDHDAAAEPEADPGEAFGELPPGLGKFDVMNQSLEAMQSVITRFRLAGHPPDVLVRVPKDACRTLDFHRSVEMIELGRALTAAALDAAETPTGDP
jgi:NTE family protein